MMFNRLPDYADELMKTSESILNETHSKSIEDAFEILILQPLANIVQPDKTSACCIIIDALDELPSGVWEKQYAQVHLRVVRTCTYVWICVDM